MEPIIHRILAPSLPQKKLRPIGECIYCRRKPPEIRLTNEHIIADGLGGDLVLPESSCEDCARTTGRSEQIILRGMLKQPRGALGIRSRKKRPKQTTLTVNVAEDGKPPQYKDIPLTDEMPAMLLTIVGDHDPGILRGAPREEAWKGRVQLCAEHDFTRRMGRVTGEKAFRFGFRVHAGVFGQVIAKTCHAYAVAQLGVDGFEPYLSDYIRAHEPPFDSYHLASFAHGPQTDCLHEISLRTVQVPRSTHAGVWLEDVYAVGWRMFGVISAPVFMAIVGKPIR